MSLKYISQIDGLKSSIIFTYLSDLKYLIKKDDYSGAVRIFDYIRGLLFGLNVRHKYNVCLKYGDLIEYLSFYSNSLEKVKYIIVVNRNLEKIKYSIKEYK